MPTSIASQDSHWAAAFLDVGYERGGKGPQAFDCWSYFRWVQKEHFGRNLPEHASPPSLRAIVKAMPKWAEEFGWECVANPREGDALFMAHLKHSTHIGIVADVVPIKVLHCPEGGAVLHSRYHLDLLGWRLMGFYRPVI